ncbi:hypothetical protein HK096_007610 [Nowakowskiella sp. JEL0078]|nr:hypothetical protein HK096_007610 [Nowakowskiella sp. JEL0078]
MLKRPTVFTFFVLLIFIFAYYNYTNNNIAYITSKSEFKIADIPAFCTPQSSSQPLHCPVCPITSELVIPNEPANDLTGPQAKILPVFQHSANLDSNVSKLANQLDFSTEWFKNTHAKLFAEKMTFHRKRWELVYIANVVIELGLCVEGKKGLVWAAGEEPLVSFFAGMGCKILATDMPASSDSTAWSGTNQFASSKDILFLERFVDRKNFDQTQDMNYVPIDTRSTYDFLWSTCSVEHVGSILLGQRFILNSMDLLKPGGVAIHTTEFTLSSTGNTVDSGVTVLWRKQDIEYLAQALIILGFDVFPLDFGAGTGIFDQTPDLPPYKAENHIKLQIGSHVSTSYGIIIRKPASWANKLTKDQNLCN